MTPRLEGSRLILGPSNPRYFGNLLRGNKIANLAQDVPLRPCWVDRFVFHPCLVAGPKRQPNTFFSKPGGWLCFFLFFGGPAHSIASHWSRISRTRTGEAAEKQKERIVRAVSCYKYVTPTGFGPSA